MINKIAEAANPMYLLIFTIFPYLLFMDVFRI